MANHSGESSSNQDWFVYQDNQQTGPFSEQQVLQMFTSKMIAQDAYLFKVGWKDWRPVEDTYGELGMPEKGPATPSRRSGAPRASIAGRVIVHNGGQLVIGSGANISTTGIFVETADQIFSVGECLKLSVKCDGLKGPFNVDANVIRYNSDPRFPVGYGLKFNKLDGGLVKEIQRLVDQQNMGRKKEHRLAK